MQQLVQNLKDGKMSIIETSPGLPTPGQIQIRVHYSTISAGTEGRTVRDARASYIGKAKSRPAEVTKVFQMVKSQGLKNTYQLVMNILETPSTLGYSCAGEVISVGAGVREFHVGDHVACGGAGHAEVVTVGRNLCALAAPEVDLAHASLATVAAIALQGIRQADLRLGESCVVIGLGLIGQLTVLLLQAAGVKPLGIDIDTSQVMATCKLGSCQAWPRSEPGLEAQILSATRGYGADAVIITAGTSSLDPVELAGALCRKKGKVVIVGAVPTGFSRANYYRKELDLRMSASYGPGRYDPLYEEKGLDYPIAYVRWTEQRNMQAYLDLLAAKKIDVTPLITYVFPFKKAAEAYELIIDKKEPFAGILLRYDVEKPLQRSLTLRPEAPAGASEPVIGIIGAGNFAQNVLLPAVHKAGIGVLAGVAESQPAAARSVADKYGFSFVSGDADEVITRNNINTLFIATRHSSHCPQVLAGLRADKNVFVEKPLCMSEVELEEIAAEYNRRQVRLMVGFNRRFAPLLQILRDRLPASAPRSILYRINAGIVPPDHWVHDPETGGGRILGEGCHFIDLAAYLAGSPITCVYAEPMRALPQLDDTVIIHLSFYNGSIASICYFSNGNKNAPKEELEVFSGGIVAHLDDFQRLAVISDSGKKVFKGNGDKGHAAEVRAFLQSIRDGSPAPISFGDIYNTMKATFKAIESIRTTTRITLETSDF